MLFSGENGTCAHEFILDLRPIQGATGVEAGRRQAPHGLRLPRADHVVGPVAGTLMIEPTESSPRRSSTASATLSSRFEVKSATLRTVRWTARTTFSRTPRTRGGRHREGVEPPVPADLGAFPAEWTRSHKFWPQPLASTTLRRQKPRREPRGCGSRRRSNRLKITFCTR